MKKLIEQMVKFGVVGIICFIIDYGLLLLFKQAFSIDVLSSSALSFIISTIVNYFLSVAWVFNVDESKSKPKRFIVFIVFSIIGLLLTQLIMWLGVYKLSIDYRFVKIIATIVVMTFNFITRKIFLE